MRNSCLQVGFLRPGPKVRKLFACSTQLSTKFQLLIKTNIQKSEKVSCADVVLIMLINVKMPTIVRSSYEQDKVCAQLS